MHIALRCLLMMAALMGLLSCSGADTYIYPPGTPFSGDNMELSDYVLATTGTPGGKPGDNITPGGMVSSWWTFPEKDGGYDELRTAMRIEEDPGLDSRYFWAYQFYFENGRVAYMGLQSNGQQKGKGRVGKMAIYSVWDPLEAKAAEGSMCQTFDGEGEGFSCRRAYEWEAGKDYEFVLARWEPSWWGVSVQEIGGANRADLGAIHVPDSWGGISPKVATFVEYFWKVEDCDSIPLSISRHYSPELDGVKHIDQTYKTYGVCESGAKAELVKK